MSTEDQYYDETSWGYEESLEKLGFAYDDAGVLEIDTASSMFPQIYDFCIVNRVAIPFSIPQRFITVPLIGRDLDANQFICDLRYCLINRFE